MATPTDEIAYCRLLEQVHAALFAEGGADLAEYHALVKKMDVIWCRLGPDCHEAKSPAQVRVVAYADYLYRQKIKG